MGYSNVVIQDGRLYTMGTDGIRCLDAETGREMWLYSFSADADPHATPTVDRESVYALSVTGDLLCLAKKIGKLTWQKHLIKDFGAEEIPMGFSGSPVIAGELVVLNVNTAGIALNKRNGDLVWTSTPHTDEANKYGYHATPVLLDGAGEQRALLYSSNGLSLVEVGTGKRLWYYKHVTPGAHAADPVVCGQRVFISSGWRGATGVLIDMAEREPETVWEETTMRNEFSTSIYIDGHLYGSDGDHATWAPLRCVDVKDGAVKWSKNMKMASLTAADGKLIVLEEQGVLHVAEATSSSYVEISSAEIPLEQTDRQFYTSPVLYQGKIYCRSYKGDLVCIDVRPRA
jgi:outer membrane protein assembly factor BamB